MLKGYYTVKNEILKYEAETAKTKSFLKFFKGNFLASYMIKKWHASDRLLLRIPLKINTCEGFHHGFYRCLVMRIHICFLALKN